MRLVLALTSILMLSIAILPLSYRANAMGPGSCAGTDPNSPEYHATIKSMILDNGVKTYDVYTNRDTTIPAQKYGSYDVTIVFHTDQFGHYFSNGQFVNESSSDVPGNLWYNTDGFGINESSCLGPVRGDQDFTYKLTIRTFYVSNAQDYNNVHDPYKTTFITSRDGSPPQVEYYVNLTNLPGSPGVTYKQLSVDSTDAKGNPVNGFYTVLYDGTDKSVVKTGYTPVNFQLIMGKSYIVQAQDYGSYYFNHWSSYIGDTDRNEHISLTSDYALTAIYGNSPSASPDFTISANPNSINVRQGALESSTVTITSTNGFNSPVSLSISPSISGVAASFNPTSVTPAAGGSATSTLTVSASSSAAPGTYTLTIKGASSLSLYHTTTISLTIAQPAQTSSSVNIKSVDSANNPINGYYTALSQNGNVIKTGFTPTTFGTTSGQTYSIEVQDYGSYYFNHWSDNGSTDRDRTFTAASSAQTFTAVYSTSPPSSGDSGSSGGSSSSGTISVTTMDSTGNQIYGFYTTLWQNGAQINSTFSPDEFTVDSGQTYQVAVSDYGSFVFDHWSDGSYDRLHNAQVGDSMTAVYRAS